MAAEHKHTLVILKADYWARGYLDGEYLGDGHGIDYFIDKIWERLGVRVISDWPFEHDAEKAEDFFNGSTDEEIAEYARKLVEDADAGEGAGEVSPV